MNLEEKYQRAVEALKEISLGKGPFKIDKEEFAWSVISSMKGEAQKALAEIGEIEETNNDS